MERKEDSYLLDKAQPFGEVKNYITHPGTPIDYGYESKSLGPDKVVGNYGYDDAPGFSSQNIKGKGVDPFSYVK